MINTNRFRFRAWMIKKDEYAYDIESTWDDIECCFGDFIGVPQKYIVEQCTGLVDKTGGLIYEGDYIMEANGDVYKVVWDDNLCQFTAIGDDDPAVDTIKVFPFMADTAKEVYISGNIHVGKQINAFWCDDNHSSMVG